MGGKKGKPKKVSERNYVGKNLGRRLGSDGIKSFTENTEEDRRTMASEALQKRLNKKNSTGMANSSTNIEKQAKKEVTVEQEHETIDLSSAKMHDKQLKDSNVPLYTCDLLGEGVVLPKPQIKEAIQKYIRQKMEEEVLQYSVLLMSFLNSPLKKDAAVQIMKKYLENVLSDLNELKFRQIKISNRIFVEKVASVDGAVDFLKGVGFEEKQIQNKETNKLDSYLLLSEPNSSLIQYALLILSDEVSVKVSLFRNPKVFLFNTNDPIPERTIPDDFFKLLPEELRAMQLKRSEDVDKSTTLRTQKMRNEEAKQITVYNRSIIRIRFPDNFVLQGEFHPQELVSDLRCFVMESLEDPAESFNLLVPGRNVLLDAAKNLAESGLVPLATLYFTWNTEQKKNHQPEYLSKHWKNQSTPLTKN